MNENCGKETATERSRLCALALELSAPARILSQTRRVRRQIAKMRAVRRAYVTRNWDAQVMTEDLVPGAGGAEARRYEKQRGHPDSQRHSQSEGLSKSSEYEVGRFTEVLPPLFARSSSDTT